MLEPDSHLGKYRLIARIGAGGMGEVWKGEDTGLGRTVAIKILPPDVAADPDAVARMRREARTAAQLSHPNIATIHAIEEVDGRLFIVMEYVEGQPLSSLVRGGGMAEADVCRIGRAVADALAEAHAKGIVHRDIKPDNVIVSGARVKVLDFGIAKQIGGDLRSDDPTAVLTAVGTIIGTVRYMSPEQALGKELDSRSDLFSLGIVLYELATGRLPFRGETVTETITKIVRDEPEPSRGLTPGMVAIIRRCLEKDRARRFANAGELANALESHLAKAPTVAYTDAGHVGQTLLSVRPETVRTGQAEVSAPRRWPWVAGVVLLVLVAAIGGFIVARNVMDPMPHPIVVQSTATLAPAPVANPATQAVTVTAALEPAPPAPAPVVETATTESARPTEPTAPTAKEHLAKGMTLLHQRRMYDARRELQQAVLSEELTERERLLADVAIAIAMSNPLLVRDEARRFHAFSPDDPELVRLLREFGYDQRPVFGRRRPVGRRPRP